MTNHQGLRGLNSRIFSNSWGLEAQGWVVSGFGSPEVSPWPVGRRLLPVSSVFFLHLCPDLLLLQGHQLCRIRAHLHDLLLTAVTFLKDLFPVSATFWGTGSWDFSMGVWRGTLPSHSTIFKLHHFLRFSCLFWGFLYRNRERLVSWPSDSTFPLYLLPGWRDFTFSRAGAGSHDLAGILGTALNFLRDVWNVGWGDWLPLRIRLLPLPPFSFKTWWSPVATRNCSCCFHV